MVPSHSGRPGTSSAGGVAVVVGGGSVGDGASDVLVASAGAGYSAVSGDPPALHADATAITTITSHAVRTDPTVPPDRVPKVAPMANWTEFERAAPELAQLTKTRFASTELIMLGTLRANGWPRISPVEYLFVDDELVLGMMWRSKKALDLLRDPRCVVHSTTTSKDGDQGDAKLYGRAVDVQDAEGRRRFEEVTLEKMNFDLRGEDYHAFAIDIRSAGYTIFANEKLETKTWSAPAA